MEITRKKTRKIKCGNVEIGGDSPITVQSMTNTDTRDVESTVKQINRLAGEGCDLIRVAVLDMDAAKAIKEIKKNIYIPLISDIHFDYRLAIEAIRNGTDGLRINPGNIGSKDRVREVVEACKERQVPIRIGVNAGSLDKNIIERFGGINENSMVESALSHVRILEDMNYRNIKISIKASNVPLTLKSYIKISEMVDYPLHLGITESGAIWKGTIKSSIGIGSLLLMGIGDTIRVSLTGDPIEEVKVGKQILRSIGILKDKPEIISCPTCGRTQINLIDLVKKVEESVKDIKKPLKIAIMGCAVNGPGEAKEADIGIAGGKECGIIFKKGKIIRKVEEDKLLTELLKEIENL